MHIEVRRMWLTENSTIGEMFIDGERECYTLEDVVRPNGIKVFGATAIPAGTYKVIITLSNRFKVDLPLLLNVPGFEGIRIHCGNRSKDTEGCILVGVERDIDVITQSRVAFDRLFPKIKAALQRGESVDCTVVMSQGATVAA